MKKLITKGLYIISTIVLFLCVSLTASAQYTGTNLETGGLYTALAKDASNNLYVTRVKPNTGGATYQVVKYTNGTGAPVSIYSGLTHELSDYPWGLAVAPNGDVYISNDFTTGGGSIIKLTNNAGSYTASFFKTGRYYSALAVDATNLYTAEFDVANNNYAVSKYPLDGSAASRLYVNLKSAPGYTYPTGLAVAANGDIYVADAFSNDPSITNGGHVYKLTAASSYTATTVSTGNYATSLSLDAAGNLFSSENRGSGYALIEYANATGAGVPVYSPLHSNGIYYPWGIAVFSDARIFVADGDDGTTGGAVIHLSYTLPTVTTNPASASTTTSTTLNGLVSDNGNTTTVSFIYGTSPTLAGATTVAATTGGTINAGTGSTPVAVTINGLNPSTKYYFQVSATNAGGTVKGSILNITTAPTVSYTTPVTYLTGVGIPALIPTNSGVSLPAYGVQSGIGSGYSQPFGVATDAAGNVYVADYGNQSLTSMPPGGGTPVTLLTGYYLTGVAVDVSNNVYVTDNSGGQVLKIPASGTGTPVAIGTGFSNPYGVAVDAAGNVYVADYGNSTIDKIPVGGGATTTVGSGFSNPTGVAVDAAGDIYVADYGNGVVKEVLAGTGTIVTLGSGFSNPVGVTVDPSGNVFVADYGASTIEEILVGGSQVAISNGWESPASTAVDGVGNLYVAGYLSGGVSEVIPVGGYYIDKTLPAGLTLNPKTGVISGTGLHPSPATNYKITAYTSGGGTSTVVNIKVLPNPNLANLTISNGTLTPAFAAATVSYTASVTNDVTYVTVTPTTRDTYATAYVNGVTVPPGYASGAITLNAGPNVINVKVIAQDGVTTKTYTITVTRAPSTNALLSYLQLSAGTLNPDFSSSITSYHTAVGSGVGSITVTPYVADTTATVTVNGVPVPIQTASGNIPLNGGANVITVVVTAQDGVTTQTYTVTVTRATSTNANLLSLATNAGVLTPGFTQANTTYTKTVGLAVSSITFTPTVVVAGSTITVNGTAVASGTASAPIPLAGGNTKVTIIVTATDGVTTKTYNITVTRNASANANLFNMQVSAGTLTPSFSGETTTYHSSVGNGVSSVTVTPTTSDVNATVTVNGAAVTSGSASGAIPLAVGNNVINTVVTAQDGITMQTYSVTVTRAASTNAKLSSLTTSNGVLTPGFNNTITSYTRAVANSTTSITFTPTAVDPNATIMVNGVTVASGTASAAQPLVVGANTENIKVIAQDGVTTITYVVTVNRASGSMNTVYEPVAVAKPLENPGVAADINVHEGISPNGDGVNDFLVIENIANHPDNTLKIMNRSGQLVFEAKGYDNSTKVFDGHSSKTGQLQLPGTYFYSLDYTVRGEVKHKTGFIVLKY